MTQSLTNLVGDKNNYVATPPLDSNLDDLAPLSGAGSAPRTETTWIFVVIGVVVVGAAGAAGLLALRRLR